MARLTNSLVKLEVDSPSRPSVPAPPGDPAYRALFDTATDAILVADWDTGRFREVNSAATKLFGYTADEWSRLTGRMLAPDEGKLESQGLTQELESRGAARRTRWRFRRRDGGCFWGDVSVSVFEAGGRRYMVNIIRDVSDTVAREAELERSYRSLKETQAKLAHADRLALIGQIAAGVAHEINNPAAYISANLDALEHDLGQLTLESRKRAQLIEIVRESQSGVSRITSITRELRAFSRMSQDAIDEIDLNDVVQAACKMTGNEIRHRARLELRLNPLPLITGHADRLTQVVTNLLLNAAQSIREGEASLNRILVETEVVDDKLQVRVSDSGRGIAPNHLPHLFEPFFTTKGSGEGTGLGLALCADIVHRHGGEISVDSAKGKGSRFTLIFPMDTGLRRPNAQHSRPPQGGSAQRLRLLIIDDEPLLLRAYERMLGREHDVEVALGGEEGLRVLRARQDFDLILCDLMMPDCDGPAVYQALKQEAPELLERLHFCSGGAFTQRVTDFLTRVGRPVLEKPLNAARLSRLLAERGISHQ
ncbi:MAG: PAS domain S-box protein [Myxococcales bacterium]|nr:PAS domain S-box protein [Myxococcales bacterium]